MNKLETVKWGFIGCGNVTEIKSDPAFNKIENSIVIGVGAMHYLWLLPRLQR